MSTPAQVTASGAACDIDPFSDEFLADPFPALTQLRAAGPAMYLTRCGVRGVAGYREARAALRDRERFWPRPATATGMVRQ